MLSLQPTYFVHNTGSTTPPLRPQAKRAKHAMRVRAMGIQSSFGRLKNKVRGREVKKSLNTFPFMRLPRDIRIIIYRKAFRSTIPAQIFINPGHVSSDPLDSLLGLPLPGIYYTSRQIHQECAPFLLERTEVNVVDILAVKCLADFLRQRFASALIPGIQTLIFHSGITWRPYATHTSKSLLYACRALQHVKIEVRPFVCVDGKFEMRPQKEVIEQIDLCCLMDCEKLETLTLVCQGGKAVAKKMNSSKELVFKPLIVWVRKNLCSGGKLRLLVEYSDDTR